MCKVQCRRHTFQREFVPPRKKWATSGKELARNIQKSPSVRVDNCDGNSTKLQADSTEKKE